MRDTGLFLDSKKSLFECYEIILRGVMAKKCAVLGQIKREYAVRFFINA